MEHVLVELICKIAKKTKLKMFIHLGKTWESVKEQELFNKHSMIQIFSKQKRSPKNSKADTKKRGGGVI